MTNIVKLEQDMPVEYGYTNSEMEILRKTICPDLTDQELQLFIYNCTKASLDPFRRQIYAMKTKGRMVILTSIDGFRLIAERTGCYSPGRATSFWYNDDGHLMGATSYIKKMTKDGQWHEIPESAMMNEYDKGNFAWKTMPHVMLSKVAESRALRRAFPENLCNLYTADEMGDEKEALQETVPDVVKVTAINPKEIKYVQCLMERARPIRKKLLLERLEKEDTTIETMSRTMYINSVKYLEEK